MDDSGQTARDAVKFWPTPQTRSSMPNNRVKRPTEGRSRIANTADAVDASSD